MYNLVFSRQSLQDITKLRKSEPAAFHKLSRLLDELKIHPYGGTGHPEQLKGTTIPTWSRRITSKHRLVYSIHENIVSVAILSAYGHYDDR